MSLYNYNMHLLYITFGANLRNHIQAYFSICSFLAHKTKPSSINVITDKPAAYKSIEKHLNIFEADKKLLQEWQGPHNFFWRIKIKGIEKICKQYSNEPVLYLDADTFLYEDTDYLEEILKNRKASMFINEGPLNALKSKTMKQMARGVKKLTIAGIQQLDKHNMWNAGVVMTPNSKNGEEIKLALELCDTMCEHKVRDQFAEQFSLSIALNNTYGLAPAHKCIAHYWSNKEEWNTLITNFFVENYMMGLSFEEELRRFTQIDFSKHAVTKTVKNTNRRLKKTVDKLFSDKNQEYISYKNRL